MKSRALVPVIEPAELTRETRLPSRLEKNPVASYLARLSKSSRRTQYSALRWFAQMVGVASPETFPWWQLEYANVQLFRTTLEEKFAFNTANRYLAALRGVLEESWRLGYIDAEHFKRIVDFKPIRGSKLPTGRVVDGSEIKALFAACAADESPLGRRDAALLAMLRFCGMRRHEVVKAALENYDAADGALRIIGKGNKEREVYLAKGNAFVTAWLKVRPKPDSGPLLTPLEEVRELTPQAVLVVLRRRAEEAGIKSGSFSSHDFRRTFISELLDKGADISTVQQIVGHANTSTTQRYDRRGRNTKLAAADLLD